MATRRNQYKDFDRLMTIVLGADGVIFLAYLFFAGFGVTAGKVLTALLCVLISGASLAYLYLCKEWLRRRSFWMTVASGAVLLCVLVSLICRYPSPNPLKANQNDANQNQSSSTGEANGAEAGASDGLAFCDRYAI